ncbi:unnamed protein product [Echinostoma caproni]|uniref:Cilia- and flagella-associated protein 157 n=1 Tax=Echinostoma caproni TaxID=27848 RepID=A0A183ACR3_9TREM|nr:unnamed protein product [Echinostoma caproni]
MLVKDGSEFDAADLESVRSRLNEQSELIMLLKEHADHEMQVAREYESKFLQEEDRNAELQEEIQELRDRKQQHEITDLRRLLNTTTESMNEQISQLNERLISTNAFYEERNKQCEALELQLKQLLLEGELRKKELRAVEERRSVDFQVPVLNLNWIYLC